MSLSEHIKKHQKPKKQRSGPVWQGPCSPEANGGITFSLLSRYLCCKERFRLHVVEGLRPHRTWNHRTGYGDFWHQLEETFAAGGNLGVAFDKLASECRSIVHHYPMQAGEVEHWYNVAKVQFPIYCEYWARHADVVERTPLLQEQVFHIPYTLPSGRVVYLRGKWDSVDLVGKGKAARIVLKENKSKGQIEEEKIRRQMRMDLQTMLYVVALTQDTGIEDLEAAKMTVGGTGLPHDRAVRAIQGVIYNVVRRPLSGGKGTIVRHKPTKSNPRGESKADFYGRVAAYIKEAPESYFMRWRVDLTPEDVERFRRMCLDPILESLCEWWDYMLAHDSIIDSYSDVWGFNKKGTHFMLPFGVYNSLLEGGSTDLDGYLDNGSEVGLERVSELFPELS